MSFDRTAADGDVVSESSRELGPDVSAVVRDAVETVDENALVTGTRSARVADKLEPAKAAIVDAVTRDLGD